MLFLATNTGDFCNFKNRCTLVYMKLMVALTPALVKVTARAWMPTNSGTGASTCVVAGDVTSDGRSGAVGSREKPLLWVLAKDSGVGKDDDSSGSDGIVRDGAV
jgi:hypothetical protein